MAKTISECARRALVKIGKLPLGHTPKAALENDMIDAYNQVYARLARREIVTWSSTDSIPDEYVEDIVALMAFERSEGIPDGRYARIREAAANAPIAIAAMTDGSWVNSREYTDY